MLALKTRPVRIEAGSLSTACISQPRIHRLRTRIARPRRRAEKRARVERERPGRHDRRGEYAHSGARRPGLVPPSERNRARFRQSCERQFALQQLVGELRVGFPAALPSSPVPPDTRTSGSCPRAVLCRGVGCCVARTSRTIASSAPSVAVLRQAIGADDLIRRSARLDTSSRRHPSRWCC